jgi:hypothetical protein
VAGVLARRAVSVSCAAASSTAAIVKTPTLPVSSYTMTVMPAANPQRFEPIGQPGAVAVCSVSVPGIRSAASVVCAAVDGTEMSVIVSVRNVPTGSAPD